MRFCIKCGKVVSSSELVRGMCVDCFRKYSSIFKQKPMVKVVICSKCGSWLSKGEWNPSLPEEGVFQAVLEGLLSRYLIEGAELVNVSITEYSQLDPTRCHVKAILELKVDEKHLSIDDVFEVRIARRTCPSCIAKLAGKYKYLVQVRFTSDETPKKLLDFIKQDLLSIVKEGVVNIKEVREGVDIEVEDAVIARKILETLVKHYGAKVSSSFKQTSYDSRKSKPTGILTYSARIPVLSENDIVIYRNKIAIVKSAERNKVVIWLPDSDRYESVDIRSYWSGHLRYPTRVEHEEFYIEQVNDNAIVIKNPATGTTRRVRRSVLVHPADLKPGDKLLLIRVDNNIEAFVKPSEIG